MKKVILVGYMAAGKTTVAKLISEKIGVKYVDLDNLIEENTNLTVSNIFKQKGEIFFRKIEHKIFKENIESEESLIISTGGGTPCYANNHLFLNGKDSTSFYLKASLEVIVERLENEKAFRPLVANQKEEQLKEFVAKHLFERNHFYNQATYTILVDGKNPQHIVNEIIDLLD